MSASVRFFGTLLLFLAAVYLFAMVFTDITVYILIATLLTTILLPVTERLSHVSILGYKVSRSFAALLSFCLLLCVIGVFGSLFIPLVKEQVQNISNIDDKKLSAEYNDIVIWADQILVNYGFFDKTGGLFEELEEIKLTIIKEVQVKNIFSVLFSITGSVLVGIMAISFMSFFFLSEKGQLRMIFLDVIPNKYFEFFVTAYHKIQSLLMNYLTGLLIQMFVIFSLTTLGLTLIGVKYAVTIGCFTAIANLIPYSGPFLGASFGAIIGISTSTDLGPEFSEYFVFVGKIASVFAMVQFTDNIFLQPIIFSKSVKAHPLEIFVVIFAGANVAGVMGMILAIPVYTILKVALIELKFGYSQYHIFKS